MCSFTVASLVAHMVKNLPTHWNMYNIMYETSCQSRFDAQYWMLGAGALGRPRGMVWGGRREEGSGIRRYLVELPRAVPLEVLDVITLRRKMPSRQIA